MGNVDLLHLPDTEINGQSASVTGIRSEKKAYIRYPQPHLSPGMPFQTHSHKAAVPKQIVHFLKIPAHVGGLSQFSGYDLVAFEETLEALHHPGVRRLMFPALVPPKGSIRRDISAVPSRPGKSPM